MKGHQKRVKKEQRKKRHVRYIIFKSLFYYISSKDRSITKGAGKVTKVKGHKVRKRGNWGENNLTKCKVKRM